MPCRLHSSMAWPNVVATQCFAGLFAHRQPWMHPAGGASSRGCRRHLQAEMTQGGTPPACHRVVRQLPAMIGAQPGPFGPLAGIPDARNDPPCGFACPRGPSGRQGGARWAAVPGAPIWASSRRAQAPPQHHPGAQPPLPPPLPPPLVAYWAAAAAAAGTALPTALLPFPHSRRS